ncbi:hypothetical protein MHPYR_540013 [uncultured Mycobacterium sp.]|uniref:Uncharacterized protein n=1 Tax=uncultured Mycobacterium sp. TaxID=171292 RepID=A0A1Y5PQV6_9MYCO|nr:hypothetical protein MHPYR_540013 [uncultured Mycobacterium sp.]
MLAATDWVEAGFSLLAEDGVKGLTLDRLWRRPGPISPIAMV